MVSLAKNQSVSLAKTANKTLSNITIGLGWDPIKKKGGFLSSIFGGGGGDIDLDASLLMLDANAGVVDKVWFRQLKSKCGAVVHTGDNLTGEGDGDDEAIKVDLTRIPANVTYLGVTVNSFRGQTFNEVENSFCRVLDQNGKELVRYDLKEQGNYTATLIGMLKRSGDDWEFKALGVMGNGRTVDELTALASQNTF
ncbi:TerD family protein [Gayadomonas joobiniege]|uniref:TerD family protein n=1 Tax=Gayadomonas joobiniege TaxID=1234606 RepID=UPI00035C78D1|nr:TerD family protein [Gayadomonas joobiniege]